MGENTALYVWLALLIVFALLEGATVSLHFIWFALGSLGAVITAALGGQLYLQILAFAVISGATLAYTRPFLQKVLKTGTTRTNADRFIGESGIVTERIDNLKATGLIKVRGQMWTARATNNAETFEVGETAVAERIEGVKLFVNKVTNENVIKEEK